MANWKKIIVSGSVANLSGLQVDNLPQGEVVIGGGSGSVLYTIPINGTGSLVASTGATNVSITGSFAGDGSGLYNIPSSALQDISKIAQGDVTASVSTGSTVFSVVSGSTQFMGINDVGGVTIGSTNTASGAGSFAQGTNNVASGVGSVAEGYGTLSSGAYSNSNGLYTTASGAYSNAFGVNTIASGIASTAQGNLSVANGDYSLAQGIGTVTNVSTPGQLAEGSYNVDTPNALVVIGNGTSDSSRSNLAEFYSDHIVFTQPVTGSIFTGSFVGDGSGLTGLVTTLDINGDTGNGSVDLLTQGLTVNGTINEIETSVNNQTIQIGLPDDVVITNNLTVGGDLIVQGNVTAIQTTNLEVEDQFVLFASGSLSPVDTGIIAGGSDVALYLETNNTGTNHRWAVATGVTTSDTSATADEYLVSAKVTDDVTTAPDWGGSTNGFGNIRITSSGDIYIWA